MSLGVIPGIPESFGCSVAMESMLDPFPLSVTMEMPPPPTIPSTPSRISQVLLCKQGALSGIPISCWLLWRFSLPVMKFTRVRQRAARTGPMHAFHNHSGKKKSLNDMHDFLAELILRSTEQTSLSLFEKILRSHKHLCQNMKSQIFLIEVMTHAKFRSVDFWIYRSSSDMMSICKTSPDKQTSLP